jgi:glutathione synthase/RimK-type ligase-like ATP-grasp enzyme
MRFLIPTYPADVHAVEVAQVLEERGHETVLWHGSDFPTLQSASVDIRGGKVGWELSGLGLDEVRPPFDVVWYRRPTTPVLPATLHPGDLPVARRECYDFFAGLYHLAAPDAFWVNPLTARRAELKPVQLRDAVRAGLTVPTTLLSNDPARIRRFLEEHQGRAIYKPFHPAQWDGGDRAAVLLTSEVGLDDLPEDEILRLTPGIFQARIEKAHELRVTVMGEHMVTARLLSQESDETRTDWRAGAGRLQVEPGRLPREVEEGCLRLMRSLGILFGAFDFIVTPEGEHVFLEVNPAGQFLWVEEACPDLHLLAPFVDFLLARRPDFRWTPTEGAVRHADRYPAAAARIKDLVARHAAPENVFISSDLETGEETRDRG